MSIHSCVIQVSMLRNDHLGSKMVMLTVATRAIAVYAPNNISNTNITYDTFSCIHRIPPKTNHPNVDLGLQHPQVESCGDLCTSIPTSCMAYPQMTEHDVVPQRTIGYYVQFIIIWYVSSFDVSLLWIYFGWDVICLYTYKPLKTPSRCRYIVNTWVFPKIGVFPPKSSILIGFSIINHPFWGTPIFGNTHMLVFVGFCHVFFKQTISTGPPSIGLSDGPILLFIL